MVLRNTLQNIFGNYATGYAHAILYLVLKDWMISKLEKDFSRSSKTRERFFQYLNYLRNELLCNFPDFLLLQEGSKWLYHDVTMGKLLRRTDTPVVLYS